MNILYDLLQANSKVNYHYCLKKKPLKLNELLTLLFPQPLPQCSAAVSCLRKSYTITVNFFSYQNLYMSLCFESAFDGNFRAMCMKQ